MSNIESVFFGPFIGELGWCVSRWHGYCRMLKLNQFKNIKCIASDYDWRYPLYEFIDEFIPLPQWFTDLNLEQDCYEAVPTNSAPGSLTQADVYVELLNYYKQFYNEETTLTIRTPRGVNMYVQWHCQQMWKILEASEEAKKYVDSLLYNTVGDVITVMPRKRKRSPDRNVPEAVWEDVVDRISKRHTVIICGTKNGSALVNMRGRNIINLINRGGVDSLDILIECLHRSLLSLSSQSGPTHISLLSGCNSYVIGHEKRRHSIDENWMQTPCMFREVPNMIYGGMTADMIVSDINNFIGNLKELKNRIDSAKQYSRTSAIDSLNLLMGKGTKTLVQYDNLEEMRNGVINE